ncbi:Antitoxin Phd_YefM, type II toxin-antitoxin system [Chromohalobacter canadensis]|uniref:Antitoxin Phd_YefM, type II toxin-antitoxin system n=1 Tax=Chromohalobacter canadensis TaxID=141389 RepID=A0A285VV84_9GAMM|nr:type II toxin-antitoxin system Phd/YefM family antitoxin [Chromohalobacter canadensis]SOC58000.1 Antitoxin Phd_YefM, type II toxin-antitoxin system [Chromohalobacter canadensis]
MDTEHVSKTQFKAKALELLRRVEASGETLIVTDKGHPAIEVRQYRIEKRAPLEKLRGSVIELSDPFAPVGEDDWEALP